MPLRSVSTEFWSDTWIEELEPQDKLLFLYLLTNDRTNMLGVYEVSIKKISFDTGLTIERVRKAFEGFERLGKARYTDENYVIVKNYMKHQRFNTNMKTSALQINSNLPKSLKVKGLDDKGIDQKERFESLCKAFGKGSEIEVEVEVKEEVKEEVETEREEPLPEPIASTVSRFEEFWLAYPRKQGKDNARKDWKKFKCDDMYDLIIAQLEKFIKCDQWTKDKGVFIPAGSSFIHQKRWEDEVPDPTTMKSAYTNEELDIDGLTEEQLTMKQKLDAKVETFSNE